MADNSIVRASTAATALAPRLEVPNWVVSLTTLVLLLGLWEWFGRDINPVFGSYPTAIVESFWTMTLTPLPRR